MAGRIKILDVPLDAVNLHEAVEIASAEILKGRRIFVATPNPEMILESRLNKNFLDILNRTDLNLADGTGLLWATTYEKNVVGIKSGWHKIMVAIKTLTYIIFSPNKICRVIPGRVTGTDFFSHFFAVNRSSKSVFLLGGKDGVAKLAGDVLTQKYRAHIAGTESGSAETYDDIRLVDMINKSQAEVLFVAFGAPKQEMWIARNLSKLINIKLAVGIGGAFDFISGRIPRAPSLMRKLGIEWLYRLIRQPQRIKRIFNACIRFPCVIIKNSLQKRSPGK